MKTFGSTLRCHRLGYHELGGLGFVRIRADGPPWMVDVCPFGQMPKCSGGEHVVWWEGERDSQSLIISAIRRLFPPGEAKEQVTVVLDDDGKPVR